MGVSTDVTFDNNLDIGISGSVPVSGSLDVGSIGAIGPVTVTTGGTPLHAAVDSIGAVGPVTLALPDPITIDFDITAIPTINIGTLTLNPITINPVDLNLRIKEIPNVRAHLPADFNLGVSVLGIELICFKLCGEAQIITEPYVPNPCERCGPEPVIVREPVRGNPLAFEETM
jgi:hypothetical protein